MSVSAITWVWLGVVHYLAIACKSDSEGRGRTRKGELLRRILASFVVGKFHIEVNVEKLS